MTEITPDGQLGVDDRLATMFELQRSMQEKNFGADPYQLSGEQRLQFYKDMHIALIDELHEALDEMGWKPWATSKHFNEEAVQGELVDAFHFFMNLCMTAGMTPEDLFVKYYRKRTKNIKRQEEGYDGVSTKCPHCRRALDDDAVQCHEDPLHPGSFICFGRY